MMCEICGKRMATCTHHLIFGWGLRELCDKDNKHFKLTLELCDSCHNMGKESIHGNAVAEHLSKMLGQALWEREALLRCIDEDVREYASTEAREAFRERYERSWL